MIYYIIFGIIITGLGIYYYKRDKTYNNKLTRIYYEDALKFIFHRNERGLPASVESLKGALSLSVNKIYRILDQLENKGLIRMTSTGIELKAEGRPVVIEIIRAHRLWETYLGRETDLPIHQIHRMAENMEHDLRGDRLEALNVHLGFPTIDPHGDPIPTIDHRIKKTEIRAVTELTTGDQALIHHIEDEPYNISKKLFKLGLRPQQLIKITDKQDCKITIKFEDKEQILSTFEALNIHVVAYTGGITRKNKSLLDLSANETGIVIGLSPDIQGLARRRILDLGITPGAKITKAIVSSFGGDPVAYSIRGAKIALRKKQAGNIFIEKF